MKLSINSKNKRTVIVGMGVQGQKRKKVLGKNFLASVDIDKKKTNSNYKFLSEIDKKSYKNVFICVPDNKKKKLIFECLKNKKNVLVEKPLLLKRSELYKLYKIAIKNKVVLYTAYNHRFEPGLVDIKKFLNKKKIGKIYYCKIFYGNGTSLLVKKSKWRDKGKGVIPDLGSHLIDLCIFFFGNKIKSIKLLNSNNFENKSPDHATIELKYKNFAIYLEISLCSWKNTFNFDLYGSLGSIHLKSLCKWSKSILLTRKRKFPSGVPNKKKITYSKGDKTWKREIEYFEKLSFTKNNNNFIKEKIINLNLKKLKIN